MAGFTKTLSGWNPWRRLATRINGEIAKGDAPFPNLYTPSPAFWMQSLASHCDLITWIVPIDLFSAFAVSGGTSGTIQGSLGGIQTVEQLQKFPQQADFGWELANPGPQSGYCVDSLFKQHAYIRFSIVNAPVTGEIVVSSSYVELFQNYKAKKIYVLHGSVVRYVKVGDEHLLTLDIEKDTPPGDVSFDGASINITNFNDKVESGQPIPEKVKVDILGVKSNWDLIISDPGEGNIIEPGDFYELSDPWCIEDPYLLSGSWQGREEDKGLPNSGYNLFVTTHISPYVEGNFTGMYIFKNADTSEVSSFVPGATFRTSVDDTGTFAWAFYPFENISRETGLGEAESVNASLGGRYRDGVRYEEYNNFEPDFDALGDGASQDSTTQSSSQFDPLETATADDYINALKLNLEVVRLELSILGSTTRQNFFYDNLTGQYIKVGDNFYKILAQVTADVLDVSRRSVDGQSYLNPDVANEYSIVNHNGWLISEHYDGSDIGNSTGVFNGEISGIKYNPDDEESSAVLNVKFDSGISWRVYNRYDDPNLTENNFIYRYRETYSDKGQATNESPNGTSLNPKKMFDKFEGWKIVSPSENKEFEITNISFENAPSNRADSVMGYKVPIRVTGDITSLEGTRVYISFDNTFKTFGGFSKENGYTFDMKYFGAASDDISGLFISDKLCMDGLFRSAPYDIDIPLNARVSVCMGYLFGLDTDGSSGSTRDAALLVTVPTGGRGIASLFHTLRQEGWIAYVDPNTNRMTIRRGSLDYKEYPIKSEIAVGKYESVGVIEDGGDRISLDVDKERLRRLGFVLPVATKDGDYILFGIGSRDNLHGFIVSGDGVVNLQAANKLGINPLLIDSNEFTTSSGQIVSPVYAYKEGTSQYSIKTEVDIPADIKGGEEDIYIINGEISGVTAQYIKKSQTIEDPGLYDMIRLKDGEILLLYGQNYSSLRFNVNDIENNSGDWRTNKAVMAIGSPDDDFYWGTPLKKRFYSSGKFGDGQYPIMLMNNAEYHSSIYNPLNDTIMIFVRVLSNGGVHIGGYSIDVRNLLGNLFLVEPKDETFLPFLWRPPLIEDVFLRDFDKSWLSENGTLNTEVQDDYSYTSESKLLPDGYVRVLGPKESGSQVVFGGEMDLISTSIMPDGTYLLIYDSVSGIKMVFSDNNGRTWTGCDTVVSREGHGGVLVDHYLMYITEEGIEIKYTDWSDIYQLRTLSQQKQAGIDTTSLEESMQNRYDRMDQDLIGSGIINYQRLSGYVTPEGIIKVFYYGDMNEMVCMDTSNARSWKIADNF